MRWLALALVGCASSSEPRAWDCSSGTWEAAGEMAAPHNQAGALPLRGDRVLVAGGHAVNDTRWGEQGRIPVVEVWEEGTWSEADPLEVAAYGGVPMVHLRDGGVLRVGGFNFDGSDDHVTRFDPGDGSWTAQAPLSRAVGGHVAIGLRDGRVLVAGGFSWADEDIGLPAYDDVALFDPEVGTWTAAASLPEPRTQAGAALLPDGRVLVAGGVTSMGEERVSLSTARIYDPSADTWEATGSMVEGRTRPLHRLVDGRILVVGGSILVPDGGLVSAEIYDPESGTWSDAAAPADDRNAALVDLPDGSVMRVGGNASGTYPGLDRVERYDPVEDAWQAMPPLIHARALHGAAPLSSGALVTGGQSTTLGNLEPTWVLEAERFVCARAQRR